MKAEHRKELETNILADKMGRLISGAKEGPSRGFVFYIVAALMAVVIVFFIYRWIVTTRTQSSEMWVRIEDGDFDRLKVVYQSGLTANPGKVAHLQVAWQELWLNGIKHLGGNPAMAREIIDDAKIKYTEVAKACEGDPVFHPEALYALAVIEETSLIDKANRENVALVVEKYQAVVKSNKESAFGRLAQQRINDLEDEAKSRSILKFYMEMEDHLKGMGRPQFPGLDFNEFLKKKAG
jgi:preprotein translocase subunit YajC